MTVEVVNVNGKSKEGGNAYRKMIKLYDVFTFFNELELLEIRLKILGPHVDYFVIFEATETFSGLKKPLTFAENRDRFREYEHQIRHYVVDDTPADEEDLRQRLRKNSISELDKEIIQNALTTDNVVKGVVHWLKEFYQKEQIKKALVDLSDDDVCFISDVDEIWNPDVVIDYSKDDIFKLRQIVYSYYVNNRSNEEWAGTLATKYKNIKNGCLNHLRTASKTRYTYVENGGWHFTNQGGAERIRKKVEASYGKEDFNNEKIKSKLQQRMDANKDYFGRKFKLWIDEAGLPPYLLEHREQYEHLFKKPQETKTSAGSVIIKLHGGLGNQLFQYALGKSIALNNKVAVKFDTSWFPTQEKRKYELDHFRVTPVFAERDEVVALKKYRRNNGITGRIQELLHVDRSRYIIERGLRFHPDILQTQPPAYLDGYWQSEKYFKDIASIVRSEFQVVSLPNGENKTMLSAIQEQNSIAVHVRRGDYVQDPRANTFHGTPSILYYEQAARFVMQKIVQSVFYVFSDDLSWVRDNIRFPAQTVYVGQNNTETGFEDLRLMSSCKHHIIANSTFSWWGAWLGEHEGQIVIAPKTWFNDPTQDSRDLVPKRWIRM